MGAIVVDVNNIYGGLTVHTGDIDITDGDVNLGAVDNGLVYNGTVNYMGYIDSAGNITIGFANDLEFWADSAKRFTLDNSGLFSPFDGSTVRFSRSKQAAHAYGWFSSVGTAVALQSNSHNIASVTRSGTGTFTVNLTTAVHNSMLVQVTPRESTAHIVTALPTTTSQFICYTFTPAGALTDNCDVAMLVHSQ